MKVKSPRVARNLRSSSALAFLILHQLDDIGSVLHLLAKNGIRIDIKDSLLVLVDICDFIYEIGLIVEWRSHPAKAAASFKSVRSQPFMLQIGVLQWSNARETATKKPSDITEARSRFKRT